MFGSRSKVVRTVPSGRLRRAPEGKVSNNYEVNFGQTMNAHEFFSLPMKGVTF